MKLNKQKALDLKSKLDAYLRRLDAEETNEYKKIASGYEGIQEGLSNIMATLTSEKSEAKTMAALAELKKELGEAIRVSTPDIKGIADSIAKLEVAIKNQKVDNSDVVKAIKSLKLNIPKTQDRTDDLIKAIKGMKLEAPAFELPETLPVHIVGTEVVQKTPQPVTNFNINPLRGIVHTTAATVDASLTQLPEYGVLDNRRAVIIFNNDDTNTVFIGGSDVTASNGLPILAQSFSPVIDAGERMVLYGITSSASVDVRVMELSNDEIGG